MSSATVDRAAATTPGGGTENRALYLRATDPEQLLHGGELVEAVRADLRGLAELAAEPDDLAELRRAAVRWASAETERFRRLLAEVDGVAEVDAGARDALVRRTALACAPLALRAGAWLQWMAAPGNADDPHVLGVLALYASDVGVGHPHASRGDAYLALLRHVRLAEHAVPVARLTNDPRIADGHFYLPGLLLVMSRRPDEFRAEILGADLCLRTVGLLPPLALVREAHPGAADWDVIDLSTSRQPGQPTDTECGWAAVEALLSGTSDGAERVGLGFRWALNALREWCRSLHAELDEARDPAYDMAELLRLRATEGAVYHQRFQLQGKPLSEWLRASRTDPDGLLRALAASKLVKAGRAERSSLVNGLIAERGPMFRVFAPEDLTVIRRWIDTLPTADAPADAPVEDAAGSRPAISAPGVHVTARVHAALEPAGADLTAEPASLREAYHLLQRRTATPAAHRFARRYVLGWLARSRHGLAGDDSGLPVRWGPQGLRQWLLDQHSRHDRDFQATADIPMPTREELVDSTVQLAPLTLIDGAWLQGFTDYEHVSSEQGHFLFETYWDELGNGEARLNHPLIYREVLAEMDVHLPPTGSREFAEWPGFRDRSFELPVYWLCIGRFPRTFLPEVLGLNLAMELSGVGGSYRRARLALRKYGFSTRFVDIHNTIDNVATGHSAWAAEAVDTYVSAVRTSAGADAQAAIWERVRTGFRSLNPPSGFWARRAFRRASRSARSLTDTAEEKNRD